MIEISEIALIVLSESLRASGIERQRGLRLKEEGDKLILTIDKPGEKDRVISRDGQRVLIIAPEFEAWFGDAFIDAEDTAEGPELMIRSCRKD